MSQPISSSSTTVQEPANNPTLPSFLETAGRATKIAVGVLLGIVAMGCLGIGLTMTPFSPEIGASALALSAALFSVAGYLIYNGSSSSAAVLGSRSISIF